MSQINRRDFLRNAAAVSAALPLCGLVANRAFAADTVVKEADVIKLDDPMAKALKYVHDASKSTERKDKMGVKAAEQKCENCPLYTVASAGVLEGSKEKVAKCTMLGNKFVHANGWCAGWTKK